MYSTANNLQRALRLLRTRSWILGILFYSMCSNSLTAGQSIKSQFAISPQPSSGYSNLIVDNATGYIYLGLMNQLYRLDSNLNVLQTVVTGPQLDNPSCFDNTSFGQSCAGAGLTVTLQPTNNYNQILVIDANRGNLITCGTLFQGTCQTRKLTDITNAVNYTSVDSFVASNNKDEPTVAFVGPGPFGDNVLYVASSLSSSTQLQFSFRRYSDGTISSRYLDWTNRSFTVFEQTINNIKYGTRAALTQASASKKLFNYVAGFGFNNYSYFFSIFSDGQPDSPTSKIIQVCQQDMNFDTYTDMRLTCGSFNQIQSAALVQPGSLLANSLGMSSGDFLVVAVFNSSTTADSAVCSYKISDIRTAFTANIVKCAKGSTDVISTYYFDSSSRSCSQVSGANITDTYCGSSQVSSTAQRNSPLTGQNPLDGSSSLILFPGVQLTGVASASIDGHTTLFLGTSNGQLKKVLFDSIAGATVFENIAVDSSQSAINKDMIFSSGNDSLYLMSANMVYKVAVSNCGQYQSCALCLGVGDPYCGWCTLQNSCLQRSSCGNSSLINRWQNKLASSSAQCSSVTSVTPAQSDISQNLNITLTIPALPAPQADERYLCVFGSNSFTSAATYSTEQLVCPTPAAKPTIDQLSDFVSLNVSVKITSANTNFVQTSYVFYSCSKHSTCSSCTGAQWGCQWCLSTNTCQQQTSTAPCSRSLLSATAMCPVLSPNNLEILLPSGVSKQITVTGSNFPTLQGGEGGYNCVVSTSPASTQLPAQRTSPSSIVCSSFSYVSNLVTLQLSVTWGNSNLIENNYNVTVFDCSWLAGGDCSTCLSLAGTSATSKYGCVWCSANSCQSNVTCTSGSSLCPAPVVSQISPVTGAIDGWTKLTISGTNLGYNFGQVQVTVGGMACVGIPSEYIVSKKYACTVAGGSGSASVQVSVNKNPVTPLSAPATFTYQNPQLTGLSPTLGPLYGGTMLTLTGTQLDTGSNTTVLLAGSLCPIDQSQSNSSQIVCAAPPAQSPTIISSIVVLFDGATRNVPTSFVYTVDPTVTSVSPTGSFKSGGCILTVTGSTLQSGLNPRAVFNLAENLMLSVSPSSLTSSQLTVVSPVMPSSVLAGLYSISFQVDSTQTLNSTLNFTISDDPKFDAFLGGSKAYNGIDNLQLTGSGFSSPCVKSSIVILIGSKPCNICANCITEGTIYCVPPADLKTSILSSQIEVIVTVGNIKKNLGNLVLSTNGLTWQIAIAVIGGAFIIVVIVLIAVFTRKSFKSKRDYKRLQAQMDALESRVRNECRQAFADLQTEVSDFTSDIHIKGIPFWGYKMYSFKLLFQGANDHRILHLPNNPKNKHGGFNQKMHQFNQLLSSKYFLLIFIRTLERQEMEFGMKDRANVASLLMVILLNKMEYATDIIEVLLGELIERSVEKKTPKIMLRRTESVVEKLLANWLSLAMYGHIKKQAGPALFMLFKAIKHQTEKGPVDAITFEARYALAENRLLREKINPTTLTLNVLEGENESRAPVTCKMLDCDTITQAKEKALDAIYMNAPYSGRPPLNRVELIWKAGHTGRLPLHDEDKTTVFVDGWKHVNTLGHYHIPDLSTFALIHKSDSEDSVHSINGMVEIDSGTSLKAITVEVEGNKVCHLAKQEDNQNSNRTQKVISEIFLTRLLSTKMTLQQYVDDLFKTIFHVDSTGNMDIPPAVKYLYDFMDSAALKHGITDADVVHAWKSNSLPLRFWVNMITNPEFLFDINKSVVAESCLSVIAQAFMESCSTHEHRPTKDAPTTKLLFAKDIPRYRTWVEQFYRGVKEAPAISSKVMNQRMTDLSMDYVADFNLEVALQDLYQYASQYKYELLTALDNDPSAKKMHFGNRFQQLENISVNEMD